MAQVLQRGTEGWVPTALTSFSNEANLQAVLEADPGLVPGCAGAAVAREFPVPGSGFLDIAMVDSLGVVTLVECKLQANPQIRREVIGQVLAYASGIQAMPLGDFKSAWAARTGKQLWEQVQAASAGPSAQTEAAFDERLATALESGELRLVVAVDQITPELKAIVEFLSQHLDARVQLMALELGYFRQNGVELLVVESYGQELEAVREPGKRRWTMEDLTTATNKVPAPVERAFIEALFDHAKKHNARVQGGTGQNPSAGLYYRVGSKTPSLWSIYLKPTGPTIAFNLGSVANASEQAGQVFFKSLSVGNLAAAIPNLSADKMSVYPEVAVSSLVSAGVSAEDVRRAFDAALGADEADEARSNSAASAEDNGSAAYDPVSTVVPEQA